MQLLSKHCLFPRFPVSFLALTKAHLSIFATRGVLVNSACMKFLEPLSDWCRGSWLPPGGWLHLASFGGICRQFMEDDGTDTTDWPKSSRTPLGHHISVHLTLLLLLFIARFCSGWHSEWIRRHSAKHCVRNLFKLPCCEKITHLQPMM